MTGKKGQYFGAPVRRLEDRRLVTGSGTFSDDVASPGVLRAVVVRAPLAHADIVSIDVADAKKSPGVRAVLTGHDYAASGLGDIPCTSIPGFVGKDNWTPTPSPALVRDRVRCVGDPVAVVVADSLAEAMDAAELVDIDYDMLPVAASIEAALADGAPEIWPDTERNIAFKSEFGDRGAAQTALDAAAYVVEVTLKNGRVYGCPLEPRSSLGHYHAGEGRYSLVTSTQNPHSVRQFLANAIFRKPAHRFHVRAGDVGGGFGTKGRLYPEDILVLWTAEITGRPVKWTADRSETFIADFHGRDQLGTGRLGVDADGRIVGLEVETFHNVGARLGPATGVAPFWCGRLMCGPYDIKAAHVTVRGVFSNTRPTTSYRGAGRPEATFLIERLIDKAARAVGIDPVDMRRRNLIAADRMPYKTALMDTYDSGDYPATLDRALAASDWDGFEARREQSARSGKLRGRGICTYVEACSVGSERMEIRFDPSGAATIVAGTFSHGQGHETVFTQFASDWLGIPMDQIGFLQGDTDKVVFGGGTYASRSTCLGGSALKLAADQVIEKGRRIAARLLDAAPEAVEFDDGIYTVAGTNRTASIGDVAKSTFGFGHPSELGVGIEGVGYVDAAQHNFPSGCHIVELEVDPEDGTVTLDRYTAVDDVGRVANALLLDGQVHGSVAQGIGQALLESVIYDEDGQLLSGSFVDYAMPRAADAPTIAAETLNTPTPTNLIGVKGGAEVGTVGAPPAIMQAIRSALEPLGVSDIEMPATPPRVWEAIRLARKEPGKDNGQAS